MPCNAHTENEYKMWKRQNFFHGKRLCEQFMESQWDKTRQLDTWLTAL